MKKMFIAFLSLTSLLSFSSAFAISMDTAPALSSSTETSLSLDWNDLEGALWYYIYYSKQSGATDGYDFEWVDLIESSETTLENLERDTTYYIALTVVDDNGNESQFSPEASFATGNQSSTPVESSTFALDGVVVLSANQIELEFNAALDNSENAVRELRIVEKQSGSEVFVSESSLNSTSSNKLIATMSTDLVEEAQYNVTVVSIQDINKNNIESGIDWISTFIVPRWSTTSYEETNQIPVEVVDLEVEVPVESEVEVPELNAAGTDATNTEDQSKAGQQLSDDEIMKTAELAAKDNEALPETGPETVFLLLLAILLGWGLFFLHSRKA